MDPQPGEAALKAVSAADGDDASALSGTKLFEGHGDR